MYGYTVCRPAKGCQPPCGRLFRQFRQVWTRRTPRNLWRNQSQVEGRNTEHTVMKRDAVITALGTTISRAKIRMMTPRRLATAALSVRAGVRHVPVLARGQRLCQDGAGSGPREVRRRRYTLGRYGRHWKASDQPDVGFRVIRVIRVGQLAEPPVPCPNGAARAIFVGTRAVRAVVVQRSTR